MDFEGADSTFTENPEADTMPSFRNSMTRGSVVDKNKPWSP
jgi:hypothetical protein